MAELRVALHLGDLALFTAHADGVQHGAEALAVMAARERPDLLILSGNITQHGTEAQFEAAQALVSRIGAARVLAVPGIHDLPRWDWVQRVLNPYGAFTLAFDAEPEPVVKSARLWVAGVCSAVWWRQREGFISRGQAEHAAWVLSHAPPGALRVVAVHHPPWDQAAPSKSPPFSGFPAAMALWRQSGVDLILSSQTRRRAMHWLGTTDAPGIFPCTSPGMRLAQAGRALPQPGRGPAPAVNLLRAQGRGCWVLERWELNDGQFGFVTRTALVSHGDTSDPAEVVTSWEPVPHHLHCCGQHSRARSALSAPSYSRLRCGLALAAACAA